MTIREKYLESSVLIRFADCDPLNHLNNARYVDYFMNAREDHLMHFYDMTIYDIAKKTGKTWVVTENRIAYIRPAWLMETVVIQSSLVRVAEKGLWVEMHMYNEDKTELKALLWSKLAHYDMKTKRAVPHDEDIMLDLKSVEVPLSPDITFEERIEQLKDSVAVAK